MSKQFETTRPTGRPSWPTILLAGIEGSGKSWTAATASGLDLFGRTFFLEVGEQMADEYGAIPGADYEIIMHDGSERQIIQAAQWAAEQPTVDGKPNLMIIDSMTEVWQVIQDEQQRIANERAAKKGRANVVEAPITMDQWNVAKDHFNDIVMAARRFPGPVLLTARLDNVSVVEGGQPTGEKIWKVRSEKNLPYHATVIMQAREVRKWMMTKVASRELQMPPEGFLAWPDFTIEELLIRLGLDVDTEVSESTYVRPTANRQPDETSEEPQQATMSPAEVNSGQLPDNLVEVIGQLEADLNRDELFRLYKIAENMARRQVPRARTHMARIEAAGKRVARRLESGETPPVAEPKREEPVENEPAEPAAAEHEPVEEPASEQPAEQPVEEPTAEQPAAHEEHGTNKDSGEPIDPPESRKDTRLRAATIKILETEHGDKVNDYVFSQIGLEVDETSTQRLQQLSAATDGANA
ncbi:AAA-ATPase [Gordonia phage Clawz]|uniref:AAA-ATPase n=1 Tax=Gordonia phage Clawz TaxID=2743910 RepID=A0AAE7F9Q1_9CAUD|nr:AAA-ATPase [Gordonia phage Clawz]QKY79997.1 AAA-ATPase [Gordonia phage Clawz]